ncbi:MAG: hypothetical protein RIR66_1149 [Actinomycetota bacterium]
MLPTNANMDESAPIVVGLLGGNPEVLEHLENLFPDNCAILELGDRELELGALCSCDAIIGLLDGNLGVSPTMITSWSDAIDHDLPRIILAINAVTGRADFDEAIALSELVLNEDIAMRYYPIEDETSPKYVGLLDVLTHEILQPNMTPIPADQEHVNLTVDEHEELVDLLAHADLSDGVFESHTSGMPVSLPKLRTLWDEVALVTVLPLDQWISDEVLMTWINNRGPKWIPTVSKDEIASDVLSTDQTVGIGICDGIARMWHVGKPTKLELRTENSEVIELAGDVPSNLLRDHRIRIGDTIRPLNTNYLVTAPSQ